MFEDHLRDYPEITPLITNIYQNIRTLALRKFSNDHVKAIKDFLIANPSMQKHENLFMKLLKYQSMKLLMEAAYDWCNKKYIDAFDKTTEALEITGEQDGNDIPTADKLCSKLAAMCQIFNIDYGFDQMVEVYEDWADR